MVFAKWRIRAWPSQNDIGRILSVAARAALAAMSERAEAGS